MPSVGSTQHIRRFSPGGPSETDRTRRSSTEPQEIPCFLIPGDHIFSLRNPAIAELIGSPSVVDRRLPSSDYNPKAGR